MARLHLSPGAPPQDLYAGTRASAESAIYLKARVGYGPSMPHSLSKHGVEYDERYVWD
jgi:hypothetical protein